MIAGLRGDFDGVGTACKSWPGTCRKYRKTCCRRAGWQAGATRHPTPQIQWPAPHTLKPQQFSKTAESWPFVQQIMHCQRQSFATTSTAGIARQLQPWLTQSGLLWVLNPGHYAYLHRMAWGAPWAWPSAKSLSDWALRPGYPYRIAIINAFQTVGGHVHRMLPIVIAEALMQDRLAMCLAAPAMQYPIVSLQPPSLSQLQLVVHSIIQTVADIGRVIQLVILLVPLACWAPLAFSYGYKRRLWTRSFRQRLERLGPAFIKWGQWAATRRDMFPPDLCKELEHLHNQAPTHSLVHTKAAIQRAFSSSLGDLFQEFGEKPVASGSIAQVYRARLSAKGALHTGFQAGTEVAVKVRHPGVVRAIQRDFALMQRLAQLASLLPPLRNMHLTETLAQFAAPLQEQVDLSLEAQHLLQFNINFRHDSNIRFPMPVYPYVAPQVLVETFEAGEGISRYISEDSAVTPHNQQLAALGHRTVLSMMLQHNFIHGDLHPGNIMVRLEPPSSRLLQSVAKLRSLFGAGCNDPAAWLQPRIVLLDAGMVTRLSETDQQSMLKLFQSLCSMDGQGVAKAVLSFSGSKQSCCEPEAFAASCEEYYAKLRQAESWTDTQYKNSSDALSAMLELVRQHKVSLPGHICAAVVTTLVLEGWSSKLDPEQSIMDDIKTVTAFGQN